VRGRAHWEGRHATILTELITCHELSGNLMPDAILAALAIEHGLTICSADSDFARFDEVTWTNPVA
jgi:predicted nucleic acid-binding protein